METSVDIDNYFVDKNYKEMIKEFLRPTLKYGVNMIKTKWERI